MQKHHRENPSAYEADFYAWTQHQAELLRALNRAAGHLPEDLDTDHLAEEIADLGKAELRGATSLILQIFIHLIKAASDPYSLAIRHWRTETKAFQKELLRYFEPSMRQRISIQELWEDALDLAGSALSENELEVAPTIAQACPFSLDDLTGRQFDFSEALLRLTRLPGAG